MRYLWREVNGRRRVLQEVLAVAFAGSARAAETARGTESIAVPVGDDRVHLVVRRFGRGGLRYLSLHENEQTAVQAATAVLGQRAGTLIELRGRGRRLVSFHDGVRPLAFDPNRIFTDPGVERTLRRYGSYTDAGIQAALRLRSAVLPLLDGRPDEPVVALHNNAGSSYSIQAYRPGGVHAADVQALALHPDRAPHAFFLVTRAPLFEALRNAGFNVVLQNDRPADDGSLAVWMQQQGRAYVNVEARYGALREQQSMLEAVAALGRS
jgi:hypothetical protein